MAVAAVESTRKWGVSSGPGVPAGLPVRDILLLHRTGRLSLCIGSRHVCNVAVDVRAPGRLQLYAPISGAERPAERGTGPSWMQHLKVCLREFLHE